MIDDSNKGSPKNQGVNAQSDKKAFHTQFTPPPPSESGVKDSGTKSPPKGSLPTPDQAEKTDYITTNDVAKIMGVDRTTVIYWRKCKLFNADMIDHCGVYYYKVERVMQLKSVYHKDWKKGSYAAYKASTKGEMSPVKVMCMQKAADDVRLQIELEEIEKKYTSREIEPAKKDETGLTVEDRDFIFSGNSSDLTFANRLERFCNNRVKWLTDSEHWLIFNGQIWQHGSEKNSCVSPLARKLAEAMTQNAESKAERDLADKFQSAKKIGAAITLLKSCDSILITAKDLDNHNELFCVRNGVVNLQTSELFPLEPKYLITQQSPAIYRPGYRNPTVDNFLTSILPDEETLAALIRFLGYAATGEVSEEKALFFYGGGGNGKGTLTRTLIILFGSYATTLKTSAVLLTGKTQDAGAATTELNPLENIRIAIVEELPQGGRLDVAKFKNLTGSDFIPIRKLHQEQIYIEPHFSPILSGNYRPELSDTRDPGLLRRLMNIDFVQSFIGNQRDPYLKKKLAESDALSGFLSLIVDAAILWYRDGLLESSAMKQATHAFLQENDFIGEFIDEHCQRGSNLSIPRKAFLERLKKEYPAECLRQFSNRDRALVDAIRRIDGISYDGKSGVYRIKGIGWRNATA